MKLGRFEITKWDFKQPGIIWFEYLKGSCSCRFLTIINILFCWYDGKCK